MKSSQRGLRQCIFYAYKLPDSSFTFSWLWLQGNLSWCMMHRGKMWLDVGKMRTRTEGKVSPGDRATGHWEPLLDPPTEILAHIPTLPSLFPLPSPSAPRPCPPPPPLECPFCWYSCGCAATISGWTWKIVRGNVGRGWGHPHVCSYTHGNFANPTESEHNVHSHSPTLNYDAFILSLSTGSRSHTFALVTRCLDACCIERHLCEKTDIPFDATDS